MAVGVGGGGGGGAVVVVLYDSGTAAYQNLQYRLRTAPEDIKANMKAEYEKLRKDFHITNRNPKLVLGCLG